MSSPIDNLILDLTALNRRAESTLYQYKLVSGNFIAQAAGDPPDRLDVLRFIGKDQAQATKQFHFFILRRLFRANKWEWDFPDGSAPQVREQKQIKVEKEDVCTLIKRLPELGVEEATLVALAVMYGFRRAELAKVTRNSLSGAKLEVQAAKGGELRTHDIPESVLPFINLPKKPLGLERTGAIFGSAMTRLGLKTEKGMGWHAIRRTLLSELGLTCPTIPLTRYMGWRASGENKTLFTYTRPKYQDVDRVVYKHHPFLGEFA